MVIAVASEKRVKVAEDYLENIIRSSFDIGHVEELLQDIASELRISDAYKDGNTQVEAFYEQAFETKQHLKEGLGLARRLLESTVTLEQEEIERIVHMGDALKTADDILKKAAQMQPGDSMHLPEYVIHGAQKAEPVIARLMPILTAEGMQAAFERYNSDLDIRTELSGGQGAYTAHQAQKLDNWEHNPLASARESNAYRTERSSAMFGWKHDTGENTGRFRGKGDSGLTR